MKMTESVSGWLVFVLEFELGGIPSMKLMLLSQL
jgi:hypothetical protein